MKITVLSLVFSPDNVSTAQIWAGIAEDLKSYGHEVRVITTTPHFHRDASMEEKQPLRKWIGRLIQRSEYAGIPVYHILMPDKSIWLSLRMLSWINFHIVATLLGWFMCFKPDIIIFTGGRHGSFKIRSEIRQIGRYLGRILHRYRRLSFIRRERKHSP